MSKQKSAPRAGAGKSGRRKGDGVGERERTEPRTNRPTCDTCGQVHTGCNAHTKHGPNTGKPCGAQVRFGQTVCPKHGGNNPHQRKAAKDRLLEMVDPALAELRKIIDNKRTSDADKLRAIQMVLDRTGFKSGVEVTVKTEWDDLLKDTLGAISREGIEGPGIQRELPAGVPDATWEDGAQVQADARAESWREYDTEDAEEYERRPRFRNEHTVRGEVVDDNGPLPKPPDTRGVPSEYDPLAWPYPDRPQPR